MIKPVMVVIFSFAILMSIKFRVNGQCEDEDDYRTVTKCDGSKRSGSAIFVDFGKIGLPCTCIVTSSFIGELYVTSWKTTYVLCKNRVTVNKTVIVNCKDDGVEKFNVKINDTIIVKAEIQPGHTFEKFYQCLGFINYRYRKFSVKCELPPPTILSITTTTVSSAAPRFTKTSSEPLVLSKESKDVLNNKNGALFSTTYVLNISTADLKSSSEKLMSDDAETKKDTYFTTAYVLNTNTADFKSSLEESRTTDPENISVLISIATGGILLAIALIVCIIILLNRKETNNGLVMKSAIVYTNRTFENNSGLPINPLNNISQHVEEAGNSSAQNQQLGLPLTAPKINHKITSNYEVPPKNKPVDQ